MDATDDDKIKQSIGQALLEAKLELQKFANWLEFDNKSLLSIFVVVYVWSWDAMLRIRGLSDQIKVSDDLESWKPICQEMEEQREKISLDHLAHACTAGVDITSILILGYLQIMIEEIRKEVWRRVEPLKVGKQFVLWLDGLSNFRVEDFLKVIEPPPAIKLKSGKLIIRSESGEYPGSESNRSRGTQDASGIGVLPSSKSRRTISPVWVYSVFTSSCRISKCITGLGAGFPQDRRERNRGKP